MNNPWTNQNSLWESYSKPAGELEFHLSQRESWKKDPFLANQKPIPLPIISQDEKFKVDNEMAFHYAVGSILGDGGIGKPSRSPALIQTSKSLSFILWKHLIEREAGLSKKNSTSKYRIKMYKGLNFVNPDYKRSDRGSVLNLYRYNPNTHQIVLEKVRGNTNKHPINGPFLKDENNKNLYDSKGRKMRQSLSKIRTKFETITYPYFKEWHQIFYKEVKDKDKNQDDIQEAEPKNGKKKYRKCIPDNIGELFYHPLALAILFLDDGTCGKGRRYSISCGEWTWDECLKMQQVLKENFDLDVEQYNSKFDPKRKKSSSKEKDFDLEEEDFDLEEEEFNPKKEELNLKVTPNEKIVTTIRIKVESEPMFNALVGRYYLDLQNKFPGYRIQHCMKNKMLIEKIKYTGEPRDVSVKRELFDAYFLRGSKDDPRVFWPDFIALFWAKSKAHWEKLSKYVTEKKSDGDSEDNLKRLLKYIEMKEKEINK